MWQLCGSADRELLGVRVGVLSAQCKPTTSITPEWWRADWSHPAAGVGSHTVEYCCLSLHPPLSSPKYLQPSHFQGTNGGQGTFLGILSRCNFRFIKTTFFLPSVAWKGTKVAEKCSNLHPESTCKSTFKPCKRRENWTSQPMMTSNQWWAAWNWSFSADAL